ncbi:MAG: class I SAM-dependent methyltransferase, partial [Clostridiales bacterium]|nr:class I SAM-dependent methyltransferase [Clostridiales bacterium]
MKEAKEYFDNIAPKWDSFSLNNPEGVRTVINLCGLKEGCKVADIGCGTGVLFNDILSKSPSELWGIDLSDKMLEEAARKYTDSRIKLWAGSFEDFSEGNFDAAFVYRAYPHFPDKAAFAKKLASILKPGGRFIIAHNESRHVVNHRHSKGAADISDILAPAAEESRNFTELFNIDIVADTDYLYIISGTKI